MPPREIANLDNQPPDATVAPRDFMDSVRRFPSRRRNCMSNTFVRLVGIACLGLVTVVLLMVLTTRGAPNSPGLLNPCINPGNGMMPVVDSSPACQHNDTDVEGNHLHPHTPPQPPPSTL